MNLPTIDVELFKAGGLAFIVRDMPRMVQSSKSSHGLGRGAAGLRGGLDVVC